MFTEAREMSQPKPITEGQLKVVKPAISAFGRFNSWIYKLSGGRLLNKFGGGEVCVVTMTGAKTGKVRDIPLMYIPYGEGVLLVASLGGAPRHPTWYYNLVANPDIEVLVKDRRMKLTARRATADEKVQLWGICCKHYPPYDQYQRRTERDIPVFICEPRN
jgi:deazaflavin-dependent oxidoreductase (nitroreductase family)